MAMIIRKPTGPVGPSGPTGATTGGKAAVSSPQAGASAVVGAGDTSDPWRPSTEGVQGSAQTKVSEQSATAGASAKLDEQGTARPGKHNFDIKPDGALRAAADTLSTVGQPQDTAKRGGMSPLSHAENQRKKRGAPKTLAGKMYGSSNGSRFSADGEGGY